MPEYDVVKDGVLCRYDNCDHCGCLPSEAELRAAVKAAKEEWILRTCGVCGEPRTLQELEIYHYKGVDQDRWCSRVSTLTPMLLFEDRSGLTTVQFVIHPECAAKAIPHVKWGFPSVAQKG